MTIDERMNLWQFTELSPLGKKSVLIRNNIDGRLMVKCVCDEESFDVFNRLTGIVNDNLMRVYDTVLHDGKCVSICEYIEGITLENAVSSKRLFSEYEVRNIIAQLCDGLSALHKNGIIHRDITPSNIMLDSRGIVKIIDYDIVRSVKRGQSADTQVLGTPGFAAPEQFGFSQTDGRADIYSCGVLMNYLLTGRLPKEKLYFGNLTPIIQKCVEMDCDNRYRTAKELKQVVLGSKFDKRNKITKNYISYSRLPGFRSKRVFPKILTIVFFAAYAVFLFAYLNYSVNFWTELYNSPRHILTGVDFFILLTAVPYLTIGDIGGLSRFIVRRRPGIGRAIFMMIGISSLIAGVILFCMIPSM